LSAFAAYKLVQRRKAQQIPKFYCAFRATRGALSLFSHPALHEDLHAFSLVRRRRKNLLVDFQEQFVWQIEICAQQRKVKPHYSGAVGCATVCKIDRHAATRADQTIVVSLQTLKVQICFRNQFAGLWNTT
jgi:hypothetical protein